MNDENTLWVQQESRRLGISEENLLNNLITLLRTECGAIEGGLDVWLKRNQTSTEALASMLQRLEDTRSSIDETLEILKVSPQSKLE